MADSFIPVTDAAGAELVQTFENPVGPGGLSVHSEAVTLVDTAGAPINDGNPLPVSGPLTDDQLRATAVPVTDAANNAFATLSKATPNATTVELRHDDVAAGDLYIGRAPDGTATSAASWEVVRYYRSTVTGKIERQRYRTGVVWDDRASGWS